MASVNLEPIGAPIKINPSIKLARWTLLGLGFMYGVKRNNYLQRKDNERKEYEAKMKPIWDKEKAEKKALEEKKQFEQLKKDGIIIN